MQQKSNLRKYQNERHDPTLSSAEVERGVAVKLLRYG